jgi:hypothetical protein
MTAPTDRPAPFKCSCGEDSPDSVVVHRFPKDGPCYLREPDRPAPESCGCGPTTAYVDVEASACRYPATVERLKEAQAALERVPEMVPVALLLERNAEILRIGRLHAEANENADGLRARLRIAEEALAWIVTDAGYKAPEQVGPAARRWIERARAALASAPAADSGAGNICKPCSGRAGIGIQVGGIGCHCK